jgi:hypothetical protein
MSTITGFVKKTEKRSDGTHSVEIAGKTANQTLTMSDSFAQLLEGRIDPATQARFTYSDNNEITEVAISYRHDVKRKAETGMRRPLLKPTIE